MKQIRIGTLIFALLLPLLVGALSAALSSNGMAAYGEMQKPPLSPPAWLFPVAWTILYIMMGLSSYLIFVADIEFSHKFMLVVLYLIQLCLNFMWSILFFRWDAYMTAFICLMVLWCVVILCAFRFYSTSRLATLLLIPYIIWLTFAAYLNLGAYILRARGK